MWPNVVFSNGNPVVGDTVYVYYGGADHVVGSATCELADLVEYAVFLDRLPRPTISTSRIIQLKRPDSVCGTMET